MLLPLFTPAPKLKSLRLQREASSTVLRVPTKWSSMTMRPAVPILWQLQWNAVPIDEGSSTAWLRQEPPSLPDVVGMSLSSRGSSTSSNWPGFPTHNLAISHLWPYGPLCHINIQARQKIRYTSLQASTKQTSLLMTLRCNQVHRTKGAHCHHFQLSYKGNCGKRRRRMLLQGA